MDVSPMLELEGVSGVRTDLPRRRPPMRLSDSLRPLSYGAVIMTHRGHRNGRLSVCLSSLPENLEVTVCSDSIEDDDVRKDCEVAHYHDAAFFWHTPWNGRAGNARACMNSTRWEYTLFLCDDVWLFPETPHDMLRWAHIFRSHNIPMASLGVSLFDTSPEHWFDHDSGFAETWKEAPSREGWQRCLDNPTQFEAMAPSLKWSQCPCLYINPFGACFLIYRPAYEDLGGFATEYWAHDDVFHHKVWTSGRWVNMGMPGRGYVHFGAQSWHRGETQAFVGTFEAATGMLPEESGAHQRKAQKEWQEKLRPTLHMLGGQDDI